MADHEHGAAEIGEPLLEPLDRVQIEVVGGLVEKQDVGLLSQDDAEAEPAALAAGQRRDRARQVMRRKAEMAREDGHLVFEFVPTRQMVAIGDVGQVIEGRRLARRGVVLRALQLVS